VLRRCSGRWEKSWWPPHCPARGVIRSTVHKLDTEGGRAAAGSAPTALLERGTVFATLILQRPSCLTVRLWAAKMTAKFDTEFLFQDPPATRGQREGRSFPAFGPLASRRRPYLGPSWKTNERKYSLAVGRRTDRSGAPLPTAFEHRKKDEKVLPQRKKP